MKSMFLHAVVALIAIGSLHASAVNATLIGDTVTIMTTANIPVNAWTDNVLVGAGIELTQDDGSSHSLPGPNFPPLFTAGDSIDPETSLRNGPT